MAQIVVPFRGENGKRRLDAPEDVRSELALAMLGDVLAAATAIGRTLVVTDDEAGRALAAELGAEPVADPGGGQGAAVAAALARLGEGVVLVVNADLPCVVPHDLRTLAGAAELGAIGYVEAADGTTNALALPEQGALRAALRRRQRRPLPRSRRGHRRAGDRAARSRISATTSTRSTTCAASASAPGRGRRPRSAASCSREGRPPLRRRRRRALRARPRRRARAART